MHGAKEGGKEGYRERVREREGNRERDGEWEKREILSIWEGSINRTSIKGKGWVNAKIGWTFVTFNDLWGHTSYNKYLHIHKFGIDINFCQNRFINERVRKNFLKQKDGHKDGRKDKFFLGDVEELTFLIIILYIFLSFYIVVLKEEII